MSIKDIHIAMRQEVATLLKALKCSDKPAIARCERNLLSLNVRLRKVA